MLTLTLAILVGVATGCGLCFGADAGWGWSTFWGTAAMLTTQAIAGVMLQKKVKAAMREVELILTGGQKRLEEKANRWRFNPPGSIQAAQAEIAKEQKMFVKEALAKTEELHRFERWVPMMKRQIATAQFQLNWMTKDYAKCDALMDKVICLDPTMYAMKMARMQMLDKPIEDIRKVYAKGVKRMRYNQNVLQAAVWTWILVKRGLVDEAFKALNEALRNSDNATLKANREALANNRVAHFTNTGIGDQWWAMGLEEPKIRPQKQHQQWR